MHNTKGQFILLSALFAFLFIGCSESKAVKVKEHVLTERDLIPEGLA